MKKILAQFINEYFNLCLVGWKSIFLGLRLCSFDFRFFNRKLFKLFQNSIGVSNHFLENIEN